MTDSCQSPAGEYPREAMTVEPERGKRIPRVGDLFRCHACQRTDISWYGARWYLAGDKLLTFCMACLYSPDFSPSIDLKNHVCDKTCWRRNA
jgi:hypothetical protein